jgi:hypothetical protein
MFSAGCGGDDSGSNANTLGTSAPGDGSATSGPTSGGPGNDTATSVGDSSADSASSGPTTGPGDTAGACPAEPGPAAAECEEDCDCASDHCFFVTGFGGRCGECVVDDDCAEGGCTPPNPLADPPEGSVCNTGLAGEGCMSSDVCQEGLVCGTIVDAAPILVVSTCGECVDDTDCAGGQLCSPTIDVANFTGVKTCVDAGSVPNGQACDHLGTGNDACMSGICYVVNIMAVVQIGVCGDCAVDADCDMAAGEVCVEPAIDVDTGVVTPPMCAVP